MLSASASSSPRKNLAARKWCLSGVSKGCMPAAVCSSGKVGGGRRFRFSRSMGCANRWVDSEANSLYVGARDRETSKCRLRISLGTPR